jgi:hypothetical protein
VRNVTLKDSRMLAVIIGPDNVELEVDTERYKVDDAYRRMIHDRMDLEDGQEPIDWDCLLVSEEELEARGAKRIFDSNDYPTEEAASQALTEILSALLEDLRSEPRSRH